MGINLAGIVLAFSGAAAAVWGFGSDGAAPLRTALADASAKALRRPPAPAPTTLQVQAEVTGESARPATLVLRTGETTTTQAIQLPAFSFTLAGLSADAMVSIEVVAEGVKHAAILGTRGRMSRKAGGDGVLVPAELERLRLTPMSTALHFYARRELGFRLPTSDREHELAIRSVGIDAAYAGGRLARYAAGQVALPAGYADGYAVLENERLFGALLAEDIEAENVTGFLQDNASGVLRRAKLGTRTALLPDVPYGEPAVYSQGASVIALEGASYTQYDFAATHDARVAVSATDDGGLLLTPVAATPFYGYVTIYSPVQANVLFKATKLDERFHQQFAGDRYSLWSRTSRYRYEYPERPDMSSHEMVFDALVTAFDLDAIGLQERRLAGRYALPVPCNRPGPGGVAALRDCEYAVHAFAADGSGVVEDLGAKVDGALAPIQGGTTAPFTWRAGARGRIEVDYGDVSTTFWRVHEPDAKASTLIHVTRAGDGEAAQAMAGQSAMIDARVQPALPAQWPVGHWAYGTFEQAKDTYALLSLPTTTRFALGADGRTTQTLRYDSEPTWPVSRSYSGWRLIDGRLYDIRYRADGTTTGVRTGASCAELEAIGGQDCFAQRARYFRPLATVGSRIYGIEELYDNDRTTVTRSSRPTYHDAVPAPPDAAPTVPGRGTQAGARLR